MPSDLELSELAETIIVTAEGIVYEYILSPDNTDNRKGCYIAVGIRPGIMLRVQILGTPAMEKRVSQYRNVHEKIHRMSVTGGVSSYIGSDDTLERWPGGIGLPIELVAISGFPPMVDELLVGRTLHVVGLADKVTLQEVQRISGNPLLAQFLQTV